MSEKPKKVPLHYKLVVGAASGVFGTSLIFPLDLVKTRMQNSSTSPFSIIQQIIRKEGPRGFYSGLRVNLIGVTPEKAIKLAVNETIREHFEKLDGTVDFRHQLIAGAGAGLCQVIATNPMEIVKIRMQMQSDLPLGERLSVSQIVKDLGLSGMYRGVGITLLRDVPFSLIFFPLYSTIRESLAPSLHNTLFSGVIAGASAAVIVTPMDVIKTIYQSKGGRRKYGSVRNCFTSVVREQGVKRLMRGAVPRAVVQAPLFGITLLAFEVQKDFLSSL